ncbi:DUF1365 domain-containing protein [Cochlodiniinecator piscidefendens]|uniref:DUF1365 domain-containing protein n=1 Tax=Cochlodiniinecator piscidefendens TaxID=2715756 RepID=UPI00140B5170|nr:DUF1365 domain-containing protein [Cochlodiniinecator piscidefendens]
MKTEYIQALTTHARRGRLKNAFRYRVDYVLTPLPMQSPALLTQNRFNLWSLHDQNHGGERGNGQGENWFKEVLRHHGFPLDRAEILLLAQPKFLWFQFNPVSFWIALINGSPRAFVAEVNNTFGHRHCYFCAWDDFRPITYDMPMQAKKLMHVSPFQKVEGEYSFNFGLTDDAVNILISYRNGDEGVLATLAGKRQTATNGTLIQAAVARPMGGLRVLMLIYWQAFRLWRKKAPFLRKPPPPEDLISDGKKWREGQP